MIIRMHEYNHIYNFDIFCVKINFTIKKFVYSNFSSKLLKSKKINLKLKRIIDQRLSLFINFVKS